MQRTALAKRTAITKIQSNVLGVLWPLEVVLHCDAQ